MHNIYFDNEFLLYKQKLSKDHFLGDINEFLVSSF